MKMKCTRITQTMGFEAKRDENGNVVNSDKGHPTYASIPRWDITFEVIGERRKLSGSFNLNTTYPEMAAHYVLHGVYDFSDITSVAN